MLRLAVFSRGSRDHAESRVTARSTGCWRAPASHHEINSDADTEDMINDLDRWNREAGLRGLLNVQIALPPFVLQLDVLDGDGVRVGIQVGLRLVLRDPAAIHLIGNRQLAGLVVELDDDVFAEVFERCLRPQARSEVPHTVGPFFELGVMSDSALQRDGIVFGAAGWLAAGAR